MTSPGDTFPTLERARVLCELNRYEEALATLSPVVAREPDNAYAHCLLAQAQLGLGQDEAALQSARYAAARAPEEEWPHRLASIAASAMGDFDAAATAAREAVRCEPNSALPYVQLAFVLTRVPRGRDEALAAAQRAVELDPDSADPHMALGAVAAAAGQRDAAIRAFETALAIDPQNSLAHNELARLRMGRTNIVNPAGLAQAASGFATAVGVDPRNETSRANLEIVLRNFLSITAYFVFLDAWLFLRVSADSSNGGARVLPVVLLLVPGYFIYRFVSQVPPSLRGHLARLPWVSGPVRLAALLEALALAGILIAALAPESARPSLAITSALLALAGRIALWVERDRVGKAIPGYKPDTAIRTSLLVVLALMLGLLAFMFVAAIPSVGPAALIGVVVFGAAAAWPVRVILLRRRARF